MALPPVPLPGAAPAPPAGLAAQPPGLGMPAPQTNPGNAIGGIMKVRQAVKMLEESLSMVPMDSPLHEKILTSVKSLLQAMPDESPDMAGPQQTNLLNLVRQNAAASPLNALMGAMGGGAAGGPMAA